MPVKKTPISAACASTSAASVLGIYIFTKPTGVYPNLSRLPRVSRFHSSDELLCPGGLACCTGGTIAGPNPILNNKPLYVGIDGIKYADQDNGLNLADLYNVPVASGADSFTVATNPLFSDVPDFSLLAAPPGIDLSDQAFLPSDSSSFRTSFNDDLFPTPSETDYTAFLGPSDSSGFLSASVADGTNSIFSGSGEWSAGSDLFPQDIFNT